MCLGAIYNDSDPAPATSRDLHILQYSNGTRIEHNRKTGDVSVKTSGNVHVEASQVYVKANLVTIDANTVIEKNLTVKGAITGMGGMAISGGSSGAAAQISGSLKATGDIKAGNISLQNHKHMEQGDGKETSSAQ